MSLSHQFGYTTGSAARLPYWSLAPQIQQVLSREAISRTYATIRPYIRRTPLVEIDGADFGLASGTISLKLELLQHTGSFKARGAFTNLLVRNVPTVGVVAASGGNHGAAVAFAAQKLGVPATIFVPTVSSQAKVDRIRGYGAQLVITGDRYDDALNASREWAAQSGAMPIHAYDQIETLLGASTTGLEFEEQAPDLDTLLIACGGGGLIGGIAAWYGGRIRIVGVEPELCPTLAMAMDAGKPVDAPSSGVAADSLAPRQVGELMFPLAQAYIDHVVLVPDQAILDAQKALWTTLRILAEPGGAAAFSALLSGAYRPEPGERVGVLVCGGNTTAVSL